MFFLIRVAFWMSVVLVLLPAFGSKPVATSPSTDVKAAEAVSAATATVSDMSHFCARQPEACAVGSQAAIVLGQRAQVGARMVYTFINERMETGSIATKANVPSSGLSSKPSQQTLTSADLAPAWRGSRKNAPSQH